jgi:hypothetical protein
VKRITARQPTTDGLGRLFIRHGAAIGAERVRALLLVVPASHVYELVAATHAAMSHRAPASVASELRRTHWWPNMDRDVARIVDECMLCQAFTRAPRPTMPGASYPAAARFKSVHVDFVPMPTVTDEHGAQFNGFLLGVDRTTGAARSMPVHSKQGAELARAFEREWVHTLGAPDTLCCPCFLPAWRSERRSLLRKKHDDSCLRRNFLENKFVATKEKPKLQIALMTASFARAEYTLCRPIMSIFVSAKRLYDMMPCGSVGPISTLDRLNFWSST